MNITDAVAGKAQGMATNWLFSGGPFGSGTQFYYDEAGGGILNVMAKHVADQALSALKDVAMDAYKKLVGLDKRDKLLKKKRDADYVSFLDSKYEEYTKYGIMSRGAGLGTYMALDEAGQICRDAFMMSIPLNYQMDLQQSVNTIQSSGEIKGSFAQEQTSSENLIWYDTTALVTINSDKNLILSKVAGRDYSRKELIANGDIEFTVSGTMSTPHPDVYPAEEIKKFIQIMRYKGVVEINNQFLDQFNIKKIVIKSFNMPQQEGYKNIQKYSFTAVGIQPDEEVRVTEDTIMLFNTAMMGSDEEGGTWKDMLNKHLDGLKQGGADALSQGLSGGSGALLNNIF